MAELDNIASELLKSANEADKNYAKTRDQSQRDKAVRLRRIVENLKNLVLGASDLNGLSDVTISAPANAQVLTYNSTTGQWENQTPGGGGGGGDMLKSVYDVDNDGIVDGSETTQIIVRNSTGVTLTKGQVVYLSGATGNRPNALLSQANTEATSSKTIGIVIANITNNSDGYIAVNGTLHNLDTSAFTAGDAVWLSATTAGAYTSTIPAEPNHTVFIGYVARSHPTQGRLVIAIQNGYELNELHGVLISSEANNDLLVYESSSTLWKNKSISTIFGGTPLVSVPTLDQVTTAGNTTTNAITVGSVNSNGNVVIGGASSSGAFQSYNGYYAFSFGTSASAYNPNNNYTRIHMGASITYTDNFSGNFLWRSAGASVFEINNATINFWNTSSTIVTKHNASTGNFLIGTTTDAGYKLDVNGTARFSNDVRISTSSGATVFLGVDVNNTVRITDTYAKFQIQKTSTGGLISINGGTEAGTSYNLGNTGHIFSLGSNNTTADTFTITRPFRGNVQATTKTIVNITTSNETALSNATLLRGIYFNPTTTDWASIRAIETTSGDVILNTQSASVNSGYTTVAVGGSSGVYFQMYVGSNPTAQNLRGQIWAVGNNLLLNNPSSGYLGLYTTLYSGITVFPTTGNVHVGTSATDAGYKLDVNGTARVQGAFLEGNGSSYTSGISSTSLSSQAFIEISGASGNNSSLVYSKGGSLSTIWQVYTDGSNNYAIFRNGINREIFKIFESTKNVGIDETASSASFSDIASAKLFVSSTTKGFLQPRMTNAQALAITTPATGLQVYDTTNNKNLLYNGTAWQNIAIETWLTSGSNIYYNTGNVGIGTSTPTDKFHIVDNTNGNKFARISAGGTDASAAWVAQNDQVDNIVYRVFGSAVTGSQMGQALARSASLIANLGGTGKFLIGSYSGTDLIFGTSDQARMRLVDATGNFLIGTMTDNGNKLTVSGNIDAQGYKVNNVLGYTGILNIPTNPPGQQNIDIQGGIVINIF